MPETEIPPSMRVDYYFSLPMGLELLNFLSDLTLGVMYGRIKRNLYIVYERNRRLKLLKNTVLGPEIL